MKILSLPILGAAVLCLGLALSIAQVVMNHRAAEPSAPVVLRIAHWQLELGYREALQAVIDEYERLHPNVRIVQMPVTEKLYTQWLNTQFIGGLAPDIAEVRPATLAQDDHTALRYFLPLSDAIAQPNPYNRGTTLEQVAWRETFIDGMRSGFRAALQEYYAVPTSFLMTRLFYNRALLREARKTDAPPQTFGELLHAAKQVRELAEQRGEKLIPIVSSYGFRLVHWRYIVPFTTAFERELDTDLDGDLTPIEAYAGFVRGQVAMDHPRMAAYYECCKALADQFGEALHAIDRQQALFMFVQGRTAFLATGSWDAQSLVEQTSGKFEIGVMDTPLPAPNEPWGQFVSGRRNEADVSAGGLFAVHRFSGHREQAIDFLRFLTSQRYNEQLNRIAQWPPVIVGAQPTPLMEPFMPDPRGYDTQVNFALGPYVTQRLQAEEARFFAGEIGFDTLVRTVHEALRHPNAGGDRGWAIEYEKLARSVRGDERVLAVESGIAAINGQPLDARYQRLLLQQVRKNNGQELRHRFRELTGRVLPDN